MWPTPLETVDLVTFTEKIPNEKLHFLCSEHKNQIINLPMECVPNNREHWPWMSLDKMNRVFGC